MAQTNGRGFQGIDPDRISNETGRNDDSRAPGQQNKQQDYSQDKSRKMGSKSDSHERAAFHHDTAGFHHRQAAQHTQNGNQNSADLHGNAADQHGRAAWDHADQAQRIGSGMSKSNSQGSLNRDRDDAGSYQGRDQDRDLGRQDSDSGSRNQGSRMSGQDRDRDQDNDRDLENDNSMNNDDSRRNGRSRSNGNQNQKS